ncbi:Uncharacterised protein [uncultured Clostridium sp.]|uniref:hypothetical protein n=1 Tax=uncultured Clostridium sp. TaxID=59620 RepID=UPI0008206CD2|nr:hypothetical protein [uncultured Clostridium sp.]SCJ52653.1 Uncharacterised protein [uncultured Clostridium sp.]
MECTHERLIKTTNGESLICSDCGSIIEYSDIVLKNENEKLKMKNKELYDWIRVIENKNDSLSNENESLRKCLKTIL